MVKQQEQQQHQQYHNHKQHDYRFHCSRRSKLLRIWLGVVVVSVTLVWMIRTSSLLAVTTREATSSSGSNPVERSQKSVELEAETGSRRSISSVPKTVVLANSTIQTLSSLTRTKPTIPKSQQPTQVKKLLAEAGKAGYASYTTTVQSHVPGIPSKGGSNDFHQSSQAPPSWLLAYIEFHKKNIISVSADNSNKPGRRKGSNQPILFVKPKQKYLLYSCKPWCGGLADRLKGIVQAFYTAMCLDRVLLVEWEKQVRPKQRPPQLSAFLEPNQIAWHALVSISNNGTMNENGISAELVRTMNNRTHPFLVEPALLRMQRHHIGLEMQNNQWTNVGASVCLQEYWHRFDTKVNTNTSNVSDNSSSWWGQQLFRLAFYTMFKWNPRIRDVAEQIKRQARIERPKAYIGIHIRAGGSNLSWTDPIRHSNTKDWQKFYSCAQQIQHALTMKCSSTIRKSPLLEIYLASDSVGAKKYVLDQDSWTNETMNSSIRVMMDLDIVHIDRSRSKQTNGYNAVWGEFLILTEATCLVTSRSGFSELATHLMTSSSSPLPSSIQYGNRPCAVQFNKCDHQQVQDAVRNVMCTW